MICTEHFKFAPLRKHIAVITAPGQAAADQGQESAKGGTAPTPGVTNRP